MIELITISIGILGMLMVGILFMRLQTLNQQIGLKKHRSTVPGMSDLLNYAAVVDDGVIVGKNGSFMAAWLFKGDDNESSTEAQREQSAAFINQAFSQMGNGWVIHVDAVRRPAPSYSAKELSHFPDYVTEAIDEERRRLFENLGTMYEGYMVLTATWFPPVLAQSKFVELMFDDDALPKNQKARTTSLIEQFKREAKTIEGRLSSSLKLTRLAGNRVETEDGTTITYDDFLSWLQFCITGSSHPMVLPSNPMYLDALLGGQEFWGGVVPKVGNKFIQVVAIEGFPLESYPGILSALAEQPCEYRWSNRFIFMDQHEAANHLDKFRKKWRQKVRGFFDQVFNTNQGVVDQDALAMVGDAEAAIAEVKSGLVAMGYYTSLVVLMSEDRSVLESSSRMIEKSINRLGFAARIETLNTVDAYLGSLPGHAIENVRRPLINTLNLADLLPTNSIWTGSATAPCPYYPPQSPALMHCVTSGATPFRLNMHVRDLGHALMIGPTRSGKSTHLAVLAAQLRRYKGMCVYSFDKGLSMYPLTAGINAATEGKSGLHFSVASEGSRLAFCPLQFLETKGDRAWAMEWIDTILALNGLVTSPAQRNDIGTAIVSMHESGSRTLSEFTVTVQDAAIREALKQYTVDGMMGHLLDAEVDGLALSDFTTFEIEDLMNMGEKYALPVLLYLFRRIERNLNGQPAAILLDEAWIMFGNPAFREKIREWLKAFAKKNCFVLMATQSLVDAENSGILDAIVESTATKIFLPNVYARNEDTAALYRRMGCNNRQIDIIASAIPQRQYYYVSEKGRRLYELALGPLSLSFVGATDRESIDFIQKLQSKHGHSWVNEWLSRRDLEISNYRKTA